MLNARSELVKKLSNKAYRDAYVEAQLTMTIPDQIRAMRKERGWTQQKLAAAAGMRQSQVSRAETAGQGLPSPKALLRIASAFDVALLTWFVPYSELIAREQGFEPEAFAVQNFNDDAWLETEPSVATQLLFDSSTTPSLERGHEPLRSTIHPPALDNPEVSSRVAVNSTSPLASGGRRRRRRGSYGRRHAA